MKIFPIILALILPLLAFSQKADEIKKQALLKYERSFGINFNSDGWGVSYRFGKAKTYTNKKTWDINIGVIRDSKQKRQIYEGTNTAKSFFYGKLIHLYNLQVLRGNQKIIAEKPYWGGVEIRWFYYGGLNIGFAKPVYLYVLNSNNQNNQISLEKYDPQLHLLEDIYGRGPYTKGLSELSIHPGLTFKMGLNVEFGPFQEKTKALEAGFIIDSYAIPVQIMALNDPDYYQIRLFLAFRFGSRYNK